MQFQAQRFARLPIARKMLVIVAVFVAIVICVSFLGALRSEILTSIRAYVGGEGLWSKAEKRAVLNLSAYANSHRESDYQQYLTEISVPEGDKIARLQLSSPSPDWALVAKGFIQGRNHPEDVRSMSNLYRRFHNVRYMSQAISIWTEGDAYISQLQTIAAELRREIRSPHPDQ